MPPGGPRLRGRPHTLFLPAALALVSDAADDFYGSRSGNPNVLGYGPQAGALLITKDDLVRVRTSLGRINDELHLILGVLDQHLNSPPMPASTNWPEDVQHPHQHPRTQSFPEGPAEPIPRAPAPVVEYSTSWFWTIGEWLVWYGLIALDVGIVVMTQLFLESIGRKRGGSTIMTKRNAASLAHAKSLDASKAAAAGGSAIPAPAYTSDSQRLSVLSQEEFLAQALSDHWPKLLAGICIAFLIRLPGIILSPDSLASNLLMNFTIMVRCMSGVLFFLFDDWKLPSKVSLNPAPPASHAPPPPSAPTRPAHLGREEQHWRGTEGAAHWRGSAGGTPR